MEEDVEESASQEEGGQEAGEQGMSEEALAFLRSQPQFAQMRQLIQQNPTLLGPLLQQLGQSNPQLFQVRYFLQIHLSFNPKFF